MSFACPHFDIDRDGCFRLRADCLPGRLGCVLRDNSLFAGSAGPKDNDRGPQPRREVHPRFRKK